MVKTDRVLLNMVLNVPLLVDYVGIKYVMSSVFVLLVVPRFRGNLLGSEFRFTQDMWTCLYNYSEIRLLTSTIAK